MPNNTMTTDTPIAHNITKHTLTGTPGAITVTVVSDGVVFNHLVNLVWGFMQTTQNQNFTVSKSDSGSTLEYCNCTLIKYEYPYLLSDVIAPIMQIEGLSMRQVDGECSLVFAIDGRDVLTVTANKRVTRFNAGHIIDALCVNFENVIHRAAMLNELTTILVMSRTSLLAKVSFIDHCINKTSVLYGLESESWEHDDIIKEKVIETRRNLVAATHSGDDVLASRHANLLRWTASTRRLKANPLAKEYSMLYWDANSEIVIETFTKADLDAINMQL